jgi:hypothetical protein
MVRGTARRRCYGGTKRFAHASSRRPCRSTSFGTTSMQSIREPTRRATVFDRGARTLAARIWTPPGCQTRDGDSGSFVSAAVVYPACVRRLSSSWPTWIVAHRGPIVVPASSARAAIGLMRCRSNRRAMKSVHSLSVSSGRRSRHSFRPLLIQRTGDPYARRLSLLKTPSGGVSGGAVAAGDDSVARLGRRGVRTVEPSRGRRPEDDVRAQPLGGSAELVRDW